MSTSSPSLVSKSVPGVDERSKELRRGIVKGLIGGRRGHVASAFSVIDILRVLYDDVLKYDPKNPKWPGRDRFILSKGHGCLALYSVLADKGFIPESELGTFCKLDSILGGHPEHGKIPGVEASTGSLGHGLPIGVGMAINARIDKAPYRVFVVMGDGETNEGSVWEAALSASKHKLSNLTAVIDYNKQQSYSSTYEVCNLEPILDKWRAFGFAAGEVDGHSPEALRKIFKSVPFDSGKPSLIVCHTVKGKGIPFMEGDLNWHHKNKVSDEEVEQLLAALE